MLVVLTPLGSVWAGAPPQWWDPAWHFRVPFLLINPSSAPRTNESVFVYFRFPYGEVVNAFDELRVIDQKGREVPSLVLYESKSSGFVIGAYVMVLETLGSKEVKTEYAYYGNPLAGTPPYRIESPRPPRLNQLASFNFEGPGFNYTVRATYHFNYSSFVSSSEIPREGSASLFAIPFDRFSGWQYIPSLSTQNRAIYAAVARDSGLDIVGTLVSTNQSLRFVDLLVNGGNTTLGVISLLDFYDLSSLSRLAGSQATYHIAGGYFSISSGDASFQMRSLPQPTLAQVGNVDAVLNQTRRGLFSPEYSAAGQIALALQYNIENLRSSTGVTIDREWGTDGLAAPGFASVAPGIASIVFNQEELDSSVPSIYAEYAASLGFSKTNLSNLAQAPQRFNISIAGSSARVPSSEIGFANSIRYTVPGPGNRDFSNGTVWRSSLSASQGVSAFSSTHYWSPQQRAYSAIVSIDDNSVTNRSNASITSNELGVYGATSLWLNVTYRAVAPPEVAGKGASLYLKVGIDSRSNGVIDQSLLFPVSGFSPKEPGAIVVQNLTNDGLWHELRVNLGQLVRVQNFRLVMEMNATSTPPFVGSMALQVAQAFVEVTANPADVLSATLDQTAGSGVVTFTHQKAQIGILTPVSLQIPLWASGEAQASNGGTFNVTIASPSFRAYLGTMTPTSGDNRTTTGHKKTVYFPTSVGSRHILVLGSNSSLRGAYINGNFIHPLATSGGFVLDARVPGSSMNVGLAYRTVAFGISIVDANGRPLSAAVDVRDLFGRELFGAPVSNNGATLNLTPGSYNMSVTFDSASVGSSAVVVRSGGDMTIPVPVYRIGFRVTDVLGRAVTNAAIVLVHGGSTQTGTTDSNGETFLQLVGGATYSLKAVLAGAVLANEQITAGPNGALVSIQTSYIPTWLQVTALLMIVSFLVVATLLSRSRLTRRGRRKE